MLLDKSGLLRALQLKTEEIEIEGGTIRIQQMTGADYAGIYGNDAVKDAAGNLDSAKVSALMAVRCIIDADGNRLFTDDETGLLQGCFAGAYTKIVLAVQKLNGFGDDLKN